MGKGQGEKKVRAGLAGGSGLPLGDGFFFESAGEGGERGAGG